MSPYLIFKIISIVVMLAILLVVVATKKSGKKQKQEALDNKPEPPKMDEYELRRTTLYCLEYKLIPFYIESIQKNKGDIKNLYDIAAWERGIEAWLQASRYIDWEEIACEILGDMDEESLIFYDFPLPFDMPLAKYGAVYINKPKQIYNYYTLEKSLNGYMLCSTTTEGHGNYGKRENLSKDEFIREIMEMHGIDAAVLQKRTLIKRKFSVDDFDDLIKLTDSDYDKFIADAPYAVVCFYDLFSAHSKMMLPLLAEMATTYKDKVKVGIYDVYGDDNETVRASNNIMAMPTFLFLKQGEIRDRHIGICRKNDLKAWFEELIVEWMESQDLSKM